MRNHVMVVVRDIDDGLARLLSCDTPCVRATGVGADGNSILVRGYADEGDDDDEAYDADDLAICTLDDLCADDVGYVYDDWSGAWWLGRVIERRTGQ